MAKRITKTYDRSYNWILKKNRGGGSPRGLSLFYAKTSSCQADCHRARRVSSADMAASSVGAAYTFL